MTTLQRWLLIALIGVLPLGVYADDGDIDWVLAADIGGDGEGSRDAFVAIDFALAEGSWLSLSAGMTDSPSDQLDLNTSSYSFGLIHEVSDGFSARIAYDFWGEPDQLVTESVTLGAYGSFGDFDYSVDLEKRDINLFSDTDSPIGRRRVDMTSDGYGLSLGYEFAEDWHFGVDGMRYSYDRDPSILGNRAAVLFFSQSSLSLAYGFLDWRTGVDLRRSFGLKDLEFSWRRFRTAVDGSAADDYSVRYLFPVGDRTDLSFTLGDAKSDGFDDVWYLVVGFTYYH